MAPIWASAVSLYKMAFGQAAGPRWLFIKREAAKRKHKTRKALPFRLASKLAFKAVSLLEDRTRWPFYQCRSNRMAKPPDFNANSLLSRFSAKASPMGVLSTRGPMAVLSKQKQPDGQTSRFQQQFAFSLLSRAISLSAAGQASLGKSRPSGRFINGRPNGRFIKPEATGWPDLQISATNCIFAIILHDQFISGRAKLFSAKAGPMAVLSTRGPMAVSSRQKQPDGQTADQFTSAGQAIRSKSRPNGRFINAMPNGFYQGRSNRMGRPPDFSDKLHFRYYPARSVYQRPGQAILDKSKPNGRFINARPNGRFIKAEATGWPDLQISATICIFAIIPAQWPFYQRRSSRMARPPDFSDKLHFRYYPARSVYQRPGQAILSKSRPNCNFINARPNGRFIKSRIARHQI